MPATQYTTLLDALHDRATTDDSITYIEASDNETQYSFLELRERALRTLAAFQRHGLKQGDELIFFLRSNQHFVEAFWACMLGGIVPVPIAVGISDEHHAKAFHIFAKLQRANLYTEESFFPLLEKYANANGCQAEFATLNEHSLIAEQLSLDDSQHGTIAEVAAGDTAFIQFSSGSTRDPKGVVLTHANLLANIYDIGTRARHQEHEIALSWMPLTHDMGLIGFHLSMLVFGVSQNWIPTDLFSRRPLLWLDKVSEKRANLLGSPNFGYRHYLKSFDSKGSPGMDLSCVRLIYNGAEPISVPLCEEFLDKLAPSGLPRNSMYACYGLAEASLAVSLLEPGSEFSYVEVERAQLRIGEAVPLVQEATANSISFVLNGLPVEHCQVKVGDEDGNDLGDHVVGEIQLKGPNVTAGYYADAALNDELFTPDGFLKTGDLGFLHEQQVVITGRLKDVIFVNGLNFYPHDLETIALELGLQSQHLELGKLVVSATRPAGAEHDDILVFVLFRGALEDFVATARSVAHTINEHAGVEVKHVIPVRRIPKTTSGKIQRRLLEADYLAGEYADCLEQLHALLHPAVASPATGALSAMAQRVLDICHVVTDSNELGVEDNLFDIGFSSLDLAQIHEQIDQLYPGVLDVTEIFDHPTVAELAELLETKIA